MKPSRTHAPGYNKDASRRAFEHKNPHWNERKPYKKFSLNADKIKQFIALFENPDISSTYICEEMSLNFSEYNQVRNALKKRGLISKKAKHDGFSTSLDKLLDGMKN